MPLRRMRPLDEPAPAQAPTFEAVCRTHTPQIARWAQRLGGPKVDVEEVVQDVLLIVARRLGEFRGDAKITTWLFRITARVAANHRRAGSRRRVWGRLTRRIEETAPTDAPEPGADLEAQEARARFYRALDTLPERYRQVLVLFELEEMAGDEIARMVERPAATVRVWLHRARGEFVAAWRRDNEEGGK